ncbi:MAG: hypothetical protein QOG83_910 [Alphaproteobacteria bacterium]|jgi:hypothetical protein|nr:hypothetical protein [Alphaproteobacteria bacterium]MEA2988199.1 hypothetical protein [Alphaproteobacteria bacterium]
MLIELQDIFADRLPITVFLYGSTICVLVSALAALWLCRPVGQKTDRLAASAVSSYWPR